MLTCWTIGDEQQPVITENQIDVFCSPAKKPRVSSSSSSYVHSSSSSCLSSSVSPVDCANVSSSVVDLCQPLSFFLTSVEGIAARFNETRSLGIRGKVHCYLLLLLYNVIIVTLQCCQGVSFFIACTSLLINASLLCWYYSGIHREGDWNKCSKFTYVR